MVPELPVGLEIDRHQVIVIDVLYLPIREPDIVLIGDHAVRHLHPERYHAVENVEGIAGPSLTASQVNYALGVDAGKRHPLEPFVDFLVIIPGSLDPEDIQNLRGSEAYGIGDL